MDIDWKVVVVFDPDGTGKDFGYTVGLHDRGLPELFLWASPTDGTDPGGDWKLASVDVGHQLNRLGTRMVDGSLRPGASIDVDYDGGATHATLTLQPPVPAHGGGLEAFQAHPKATVSEVRWTLQRSPIGQRRELEPDEIEEARRRVGTLAGDERAASATFPASARFGPNTPVVELLRQRVCSMDEALLDHLIAAAYLHHRPEQELAVIQQWARPAGLVGEVEEANLMAFDDAVSLCDHHFPSDPDKAALTNLFAAVFAGAYGTEVLRHAIPAEPPASSEVIWALLDPSGDRTRRFALRVGAAAPHARRLILEPDVDALAAIIGRLDDETESDLVSLWVVAAAQGHGSGLWLGALLLAGGHPINAAWRAGLALAVVGYRALGVELPDPIAHQAEVYRRVADDALATASPHPRRRRRR